MLTPGRGYDNSRLADTEVRGNRLLRVKDARHSRDAAPFILRRGKHRGITQTAVTRNTAGTVRLFYWNGTRWAWTDVTVYARAALLNTADTIAASTAVYVELFADGQWEATNANCDVADWLGTLETTAPAGSPGEIAAGQPAVQGDQGGEALAGAIAGNQDFGQIGGLPIWQA